MVPLILYWAFELNKEEGELKSTTVMIGLQARNKTESPTHIIGTFDILLISNAVFKTRSVKYTVYGIECN